MFESYTDWIDFVKKSTYHEKSKLFTVKAEHTLLPYPMVVHIIVERPEKIGDYDFYFPTGIFTGLKGKFEIREFDGQCWVYGHSYWEGKHTGIPNLVIEVFSETLSRIGGEILMRRAN